MNDMTMPAMGHNNPPPYNPDLVEAHKVKVAEFNEALKDWQAIGELRSAEQAERLTDFIAGARKAWAEIESDRVAAKKPHDDAASAVQQAYSPLLTTLKAIAEKVKPLQAAWLKKLADEAAAEKARKKAEAEAKAAEAERIAREAAASNDVAAQIEAERLAKESAKEAKAASRGVKVSAGSATGGARAMSLRKTYSLTIDNINHAFVSYRAHPEVAALLVRLAEADVRAQKGEKVAPQGFILHVTEGVA